MWRWPLLLFLVRCALTPTIALRDRVGQRNGSDETLGVRVFGATQDLVPGALLDDSTPVHDRDPVREHVDDREVVTDEQARELQALLQLLQQVEESGLHRDVERARRLVRDEQFRGERECPGDADALALAAGELVRDSGCGSSRQLDLT